MSKTVLILALLAAVAAWGWGELVASFPCPGGSYFPNGLEYKAGRIYIATNSNPATIWQTNTTGSVYSSHAAPAGGVRGLTAGTLGEIVSYWVSCYDPAPYVYQCGYLSGTVVTSWSITGTAPYGLAYRSATQMYVADHNTRRILVVRPQSGPEAGSIVSSYNLSFQPNDLAFDSRGYLWIADYDARAVRMCKPNGSLISSFSTASVGTPSGVGYAAGYVWVGIVLPQAMICQYDVTDVGVGPESLGKVKALFR